MNIQYSYTSANSLPIKLLINSGRQIAESGSVWPVHVQLMPTNRCNLNCSFCSCKDRNQDSEWLKSEQEEILSILFRLGVDSVTITGGGEPLLYPYMTDLMNGLRSISVRAGLVTNGIELDQWMIDSRMASYFDWCRISASDERKFASFRFNPESCQMAFSYVTDGNTDIENLKQYIQYCNENPEYTHIRVVSNLLNLDNKIQVDELKEKLNEIDLSKVIFQDRSKYARGKKNCWISLLKPVIAADGYVYPCCGVQYAKSGSYDHDMPRSMRMCHYSEYESVVRENEPFDGSACEVCYYDDYNSVLEQLKMGVDHMEFV